MASEAAEGDTEDHRDDRQRQTETEVGWAPVSIGKPDVEQDQEEQGLQERVVVDKGGRQGRDGPGQPCNWVADHEPPRRRLIPAKPSSNIADPPISSQIPGGPPSPVGLAGPVSASAIFGVMETVGALASRVGVALALGGGEFMATAGGVDDEGRAGAGAAAALRVAAAGAAAAAGGQTVLNETLAGVWLAP